MTNRDVEKELVQLGRDVAPGPSLKAPVLERLEAIPERDILPPCLWRCIMTHRITRMAVAASILVALTLGVFFWERTSNITLAHALSSIDQAGSFSLETRRTRKGRYNDDIVVGRIIASDVFGMKATEWNVDPNTQQRHLLSEGVFSLLDGIVTAISHQKQSCRYSGHK